MPLHRQEFQLPDGCRLPDAYDLLLCACGCAYADVGDEAAYDHYYRTFDVYQHIEHRAKLNADARRLSLRYGPGSRETRLLDYGCGGGGLGEELRQLGFDVATYDHATGATTNSHARYDVAVSLHVLEHVVDPLRILNNIARIADEVYVEVPDSTRYDDDVLQEVNAEHVNHFTMGSLECLFYSTGLSVEFVERGWANTGTTTGARYPVLRMAGRMTGWGGGLIEPRRPDWRFNQLGGYVTRGAARLERIRCQLAGLPKFTIWGMGQLAWKVLPFCQPRQVVALVDSSPAVQGRAFGPFGIVGDPASTPAGPVLACSTIAGGIRAAAEARGFEVIGLAHA